MRRITSAPKPGHAMGLPYAPAVLDLWLGSALAVRFCSACTSTNLPSDKCSTLAAMVVFAQALLIARSAVPRAKHTLRAASTGRQLCADAATAESLAVLGVLPMNSAAPYVNIRV